MNKASAAGSQDARAVEEIKQVTCDLLDSDGKCNATHPYVAKMRLTSCCYYAPVTPMTTNCEVESTGAPAFWSNKTGDPFGAAWLVKVGVYLTTSDSLLTSW